MTTHNNNDDDDDDASTNNDSIANDINPGSNIGNNNITNETIASTAIDTTQRHPLPI